MTIKIILAGPRGKMGSEAIKMIDDTDHFSLVACLDSKKSEEKTNKIHQLVGHDIDIYDDAEKCLSTVQADVLIDLTIPETGYLHTKLALSNHLNAVVGTSGFTEEQIQSLSELAKTNQVGCVIAPNFALGAVLMMQFAKQAAKFFPDVEIIEKHHDQKLDAPSGTAKKTADLIQETREAKQQGHPDERETIKGVRGGNINGIHIHSMRLPGLVAHQEVVFGSPNQLLTLKHDSFHRSSFMDGVKLATEKVVHLDKLVYGLEHVLELN